MFRARLLAAAALALALAAPAAARPRPAPSPAVTPSLAPAPTAAPTPPSYEARIAALQADVAAIARDAPGRLAVTIVDIATGAHVEVHGAEVVPLGSLARLPVGIAAYRLADQRRFSLDARAPEPRAGASAPYWQLVRAMLARDDRSATALVLRAIGGADAVDGILGRLGLGELRVAAAPAPNANVRASTGSTDVLAALLSNVAQQKLLSLDATTEILQDMRAAAAPAEALRAGLPPALSLAHVGTESGDAGDGVTGDAGIATFPDGRRFVIAAMLTRSAAAPGARAAAIASVARAAYAAFE